MTYEEINECVGIEPRYAGMCEKRAYSRSRINIDILNHEGSQNRWYKDEDICQTNTLRVIGEEKNRLYDEEELEGVRNIVHEARYVAEFRQDSDPGFPKPRIGHHTHTPTTPASLLFKKGNEIIRTDSF